MTSDVMAVTVDLKPFVVTEEEFQVLCRADPELRLERAQTGEVIIMTPAGGETGERNGEIFGQLWQWNRRTRSGHVFDSSTGFILPNGAIRSPDASWVRATRWRALSQEDRSQFPPFCPDFVIELRSPADSLTALRAKMLEYLANGARLGWLIDPESRQVDVYRTGEQMQTLCAPQSLSGEPVLPGFVLDLTEVLPKATPHE